MLSPTPLLTPRPPHHYASWHYFYNRRGLAQYAIRNKLKRSDLTKYSHKYPSYAAHPKPGK